MSNEFPSYYANCVAIATSEYDFQISFALSDLNGQVVQPRCKVYMSPEHTKVLSQLLEAHVKNFEAFHGPIPVRKDVIEHILNTVTDYFRGELQEPEGESDA